MKRLIIALASLALMAPSAMACGNGKTCSSKACTPDMMKACAATMPQANGASASSTASKESCRSSATFDIQGMKDAGCVKKISKELNQVKGVEAVNVDLKTGKATVDFCSNEFTDTGMLLNAIKKAGYAAKN